MDDLQEYLFESVSYQKSKLIKILDKIEKWNDNPNNWIEYEQEETGEEYTGDESYIDDEIELCSEAIYFVRTYLDGFDDKDKIASDDMSEKVTQAIIDSANDGLDVLDHIQSNY